MNNAEHQMEMDQKKVRHHACMEVIRENAAAFVKVGDALREIRDDKLYLADGHFSFEDFMKSTANVFGISRSRAEMLISASTIHKLLPNVPSGNMDWNERSIRELKRLPTEAQIKKIGKRVMTTAGKHGGGITSTMVRERVDKELGVDRAAIAREKREKRAGTDQEEHLNQQRIDDELARWRVDLMRLRAKVDRFTDEEMLAIRNTHPDLVALLEDQIGLLSKTVGRGGGQ